MKEAQKKMKIQMAELDVHEAHDFITSAMAPLPIVLISTVGEDGIYNAAPFSLVIPVCHRPSIICAAFGLRGGQKKDTVRNIEFAKDFVVNIMDETLIGPTIRTAGNFPSTVDEINKVGLTAIAADSVKSPRIAEAQVSLECRLVQSLEFGEGENLHGVLFGEVVLAHVKDNLWVEGRLEPSRLRSVGRLGKGIYCRTQDILKLKPS